MTKYAASVEQKLSTTSIRHSSRVVQSGGRNPDKRHGGSRGVSANSGLGLHASRAAASTGLRLPATSQVTLVRKCRPSIVLNCGFESCDVASILLHRVEWVALGP